MTAITCTLPTTSHLISVLGHLCDAFKSKCVISSSVTYRDNFHIEVLTLFYYNFNSLRKIASDSRLCRVYFPLGPGNEAHSEAGVFEQIYPRASGL